MTVVAIDGPAGSGKSTIARLLARRLGLAHIDTGAVYRAATLAVLRAGIDPQDGPACAALIATAHIGARRGRTLLDGDDVEDEIRGPAVTDAVSAVAGHPAVRATLLAVQRAAVSAAGGVVEGRDAATAVVPDADIKIWLTADTVERGRRRALQRGEPAAAAAHAADIARRDAADATQMQIDPDAVEIDTTGRDIESLVDELAQLVTSRAAPRGTDQEA